MPAPDDIPLLLDNLGGTANPGIYSEAPVADNGAFSGAQLFSDRALLLSDERLNEVASGAASGSAKTSVRQWGQMFGSAAHQGTRDGFQGFDTRAGGVALGADTAGRFANAIVGASLSYGHAKADPRDPMLSETDIDSYQLTLYGDYKLENQAYLRGMIAYAYSDNDTERNEFGSIERGSYGANEFTVLAKTGRAYKYQNTTLTPSLLARWVHYDPSDYTESGTGTDYHVSQSSMDILETGPALDATWKKKNSDGSWLVPSVHTGYRYDLIGDKIETSYVDCCTTIIATGPSPARHRLNIGGSLTWYTTSTWEFKAGYDFDYRADYGAHTGLFRGTFRY
ncbi:MAG: autotransporter outer membrane beta-barrel domain-containing protein [Alphaproteobacteria bacterium]|nr:MAG: autotransporter outer membrane beta-barrel domain-containing protein [Alphaproteobacteria bacterium]